MGLDKPKLCTKFEVASFSHCVNIEGEPPNFGELFSPGSCPPFFCVRFYDGPWQTLAACQVAIPSHCKNIIGELQILSSTPSPKPPPLFFWCDFMMGVGKPKLCSKLEVASFSRCRNIKGKPQISGATTTFLLVGFNNGPWQTAAAFQIWSRWLHALRKYKGICFLTTNSLFGPFFGEVRGTVRTSSIARWKGRVRLPICDNWTFLLALTVDALIRR